MLIDDIWKKGKSKNNLNLLKSENQLKNNSVISITLVFLFYFS